jgi:hypothetical protein
LHFVNFFTFAFPRILRADQKSLKAENVELKSEILRWKKQKFESDFHELQATTTSKELMQQQQGRDAPNHSMVERCVISVYDINIKLS